MSGASYRNILKPCNHLAKAARLISELKKCTFYSVKLLSPTKLGT